MTARNADDPAAATLAALRPVLDVYYRALSGRPAHLLGRAGDDDPAQAPDTHTTIRLPNRIGRFGEHGHNRDWYTVALTHRAAHYACGSFGFRLERPSRLRPRLTAGAAALRRLDPETDLEHVFRSVTYRGLLIEVFTIAEDLRIDAAIPVRYPGVAAALARVQAAESAGRPDPAGLPPRSALLETFVRLSLGASGLPPLPAGLHRPALRLAAAADELRDPAARVEDAVEVALRAYELITRLPPLAAEGPPSVPAGDGADPAAAPWRIRLPEPRRARLEGDAILDASVSAVDYRDLLGWRYGGYGQPGPPGEEAIYRLRAVPGGDDQAVDDGADGDDRPEGPPEPLPHEDHEWHVDHYEHLHGALTAEAAGEYLYPEWDHVRGHYRGDWCRVRERVLPPGRSTRLYDETLRAYRDVLPRIVGRLERWAPEGRRLVGRQVDGDDLDLDACVEAVLDLRLGRSPDEAVHRRLQRVARDAAVVFLLDLSSSTAERVDGDKAGEARLARIHGRPYRRIIDLEREAVALLLAATRRTGDATGVYGFSGTGRADVRFDVVKQLGEPMSRQVAGRIESLRPVHTTRMGPAIRHATAKLRAWQASTKVLVLVSDGRPFDRDYGQEYGEGAELEYAVRDTRTALEETAAAGIRPFVLTVDTGGQDYLSDLAGDTGGPGGDVLSDVSELPLHLLTLYQRLSRR